MGKLDSLGRATFHHIASQDGVCPTNREVRWLKHIERHGPQSSVYLHELTKDTHRSQDQALRDLQKLRAGGFLFLPPQQRATERAEFNPYIYDLTPTAKRWLSDLGLAEPTVRPTGHWWHAYLVSCVTSSIDIAAARDGVRYIPAHEILARKGATLGIPVNGKLLIPDQLFALDYGGSYRAFVLEVDRGTEPCHTPTVRKSLSSMLGQYDSAMGSDFPSPDRACPEIAPCEQCHPTVDDAPWLDFTFS
jgi:Replication-relaxation